MGDHIDGHIFCTLQRGSDAIKNIFTINGKTKDTAKTQQI